MRRLWLGVMVASLAALGCEARTPSDGGVGAGLHDAGGENPPGDASAGGFDPDRSADDRQVDASVGPASDARVDARQDDARPVDDSPSITGACPDAGLGPFGPSDPGLQNSPASWTTQGSVTLDASGAGFIDLGWAVFGNRSGTLSQTFSMPRSTDGCDQGFALRVVAKSTPAPDGGGGAAAILNQGVSLVRFSRDKAYDQVTCLGDWAYGNERGQASLAVNVTAAAIVDHLSVVATRGCAMPGQVFDGDFEGQGWVTEGSAQIGPYGLMGSRAGFIPFGGALRGHLSVPYREHLEKVALAFRTKGQLDVTWSGLAAPDPIPFDEVAGFSLTIWDHGPFDSGTDLQEVRACVPAWLRGRYSTLSIVGWGVVDDFTLVSEPSCPAEALIMDGGFEGTGRVSFWTASGGGGLGADAGPQQTYAHSGLSSLHVVCGVEGVRTMITIPASRGGSAGPALTFWYDGSALASTTLAVSVAEVQGFPVSDVAIHGADAGAREWRQEKVCLHAPAVLDVPATLTIAITSSDGLCGLSAPGEAWLDDFEVTTDPACPP